MKKRKFSGKRPVLFYQDAYESTFSWFDIRSIYLSSRIRIIYPNGKAEWVTLCKGPIHTNNRKKKNGYMGKSCWAINKKFKNIEEAVKAMNKYDKYNCFPKAVFLGEL